jgi:hypothetical protein
LGLISTAKNRRELPFYYRFAGTLGIHRLLPASLLKDSNIITNWFFGVGTKFDQNLLKRILLETNTVFLKWAIDKIVSWSNVDYPDNIFHIHGSSDRILPSKYVTCDRIIKDGGHLMILNKAEEIGKILRSIIL